jgi:hypothetical protein
MATPKKAKEDWLPLGRPIGYQDTYPELLIQKMGREGWSFTRFSAYLEVAKNTAYVWLKQFPEFQDAFDKAKTMSEGYWENEVVGMMREKGVNSLLVKLYMAHRFDWHDKKDLTVNATVKHEDTLKDLE